MINLFLRPKLVGIKKKLDRRVAVRERKALSAAHIERSIEKELIERLKSKAYGDAPLNVNETVWQTILDREKNGGKDLTNEELDMEADETDEEDEEELEDEMDDWGDREFVSDISEDDDDGLSDLEDVAVSFLLLLLSFSSQRPRLLQRITCRKRVTMTNRMVKTATRLKRRGPKQPSESGRLLLRQSLRGSDPTRNQRVSLASFSSSSSLNQHRRACRRQGIRTRKRGPSRSGIRERSRECPTFAGCTCFLVAFRFYLFSCIICIEE